MDIWIYVVHGNINRRVDKSAKGRMTRSPWLLVPLVPSDPTVEEESRGRSEHEYEYAPINQSVNQG